MAGPIVQIAHLVSRIDARDREIRNLSVSHVRPVLKGASPVIATLLGDAIVWDAFHAVARLHPSRFSRIAGVSVVLDGA
jgi:hypothetical protein